MPTACIASFSLQVLAKAGKLQQLKLAHNLLTGLPQWLSAFNCLTTAVLDNNALKASPVAH